MIILETRKLEKQYSVHRRRFQALKGADLHLCEGEILGIVGESGSGKTTLLKLISGLEAPDSGQILLEGRELSPVRKKEELRTMQMIFQDPVASFHPRRTIADSIRETVRSLCGKDADLNLEELAGRIGLSPQLMDRLPQRLSGGQCQRMAIARAIAVYPRILLCDEITSALDVSSQAQILRLLSDICRSTGTSAVFVSHDLAVVSCLCDRIMVMRSGSVVEEGTVRQIIETPGEEYTRSLIRSVLEI